MVSVRAPVSLLFTWLSVRKFVSILDWVTPSELLSNLAEHGRCRRKLLNSGATFGIWRSNKSSCIVLCELSDAPALLENNMFELCAPLCTTGKPFISDSNFNLWKMCLLFIVTGRCLQWVCNNEWRSGVITLSRLFDLGSKLLCNVVQWQRRYNFYIHETVHCNMTSSNHQQRCNSVTEFIIPHTSIVQHVSSAMSLIIRNLNCIWASGLKTLAESALGVVWVGSSHSDSTKGGLRKHL
jgi:hypothetical protein